MRYLSFLFTGISAFFYNTYLTFRLQPYRCQIRNHRLAFPFYSLMLYVGVVVSNAVLYGEVIWWYALLVSLMVLFFGTICSMVAGLTMFYSYISVSVVSDFLFSILYPIFPYSQQWMLAAFSTFEIVMAVLLVVLTLKHRFHLEEKRVIPNDF